MRRVPVGTRVAALAAMALAGAAGPAQAQQLDSISFAGPGSRLVRVIDIPLTVEGSLSVEFRAGPDTGCPAPCELTGSATWTPARDGALFAWEYEVDRRRELTASVVLLETEGRTGTSVQVTSSAPGLPASSCVDARAEDFGLLNFSAARADALVARLLGPPHGPGPAADLLGSRCAGPADDDLAHLLPSIELSRDLVRRGLTTIDFSLPPRPFTAHGMTGVVSSSVKMRLGRARVTNDPEAEEDDPLPGFRTRTRRELTATYAIEQTTGTAVTTFAGVREPALCRGLDSCGASGRVEISPRPRAGQAFLVATGSRRSTRRELEAALGLRRGPVPRGVDVAGLASWDQDVGNVLTSVRTTDGRTCSDRGPLAGHGLGFRFGRRVRVQYGSLGGWERDPFSSRCSGPALTDTAVDGGLARGTLRRTAFRRGRLRVNLTDGTGFAADGYEGTTRSSLSFVLRRTGVVIDTITDVDPVG